MKRFFSFLAVLVLTFLGSIAGAQESLEKLTFFKTSDECVAAFRSGEFRYYMPAPANLKTPHALAKGTPWPGCAHEVVRESKAGSPAWVVWAANTPALFNDKGLPSQDGRCHNKVDGFIPIIPESISEAVRKNIADLDLSKLKGDKGEPGQVGPQGPKGDPGKDGSDGKDAIDNTSNFNGGSHSHKKLWLVIGAVVVSGGGLWLYNHQKDKPGAPGVRTLPTKPICTGVGCPSGSGFGASFSLGFK